MIQSQSFLFKRTAEDAWCEIIQLSHRHRLPSYLGVTKRHRTDKFLKLKKRCDSNNLLESELYRRVFKYSLGGEI